MSHSNERNPGNIQQPAEQPKQAPGGNGSAPFTKAERKPQNQPMDGNVAEPRAPNAPLIDLRSDKGDRRVNPQHSDS